MSHARTLIYIFISTFLMLTACEKAEIGTQEEKPETQKPGEEENNPNSSPSNDDTLHIKPSADFPEPWTLWNGHVVIYKYQDHPDSATIVLLSQEERSVYSVYKEGYENEAQQYADSYVEEGLGGWEIPDESVGEWLRDSCNEETHLHDVNKMLAMSIVPTKGSGGNYRYLCGGAKRTFAFVKGSRMGDAGKSSKYPLRLVKWIRLAKKND